MAFGGATSLGATGSSGNNQSTLALTLAAAGIGVGELAILVIADDNIGSGADADGNEVASVADNAAGGSNVWTKAVGWTNNMSGAQAGAHCSIWWTLAVRAVAITTGTVTATFTNNTLSDATAMTGYKFTKDATSTIAVEASNHSSVSAGAPGSLDATTANIECLRVRGIAGEVGNNVSLTKTAAFAAAWARGNSASSGTTAEMCARAEHAISTGTGLASNPTWSGVTCDIANVYAAFKEVFPAQDVHPASFPEPHTYGTWVVGRGAVDVHPATFANASAFGTLFAQLPYAGGQITALGPGGYPVRYITTAGLSLVKVFNEVEHLVEALVTSKVLVRLVAEVEHLVEASVLHFLAIRQVANEVMHVVEATLRTMPLVRLVAEVMHVVETSLRTMPLVRLVAEVEHVVEASLRVIFSDLTRVINEVINHAEALLPVQVLNRLINEVERAVEVLVTFQPIVRLVAEIVDVSAVEQRVLELFRLVAETVNAVETTLYTKVRTFVIDEVQNLVESSLASVSVDIIQLVAETVSAVETTLGLVFAEVTAIVNEAVDIVEVQVIQRVMARVVAEVERANEAMAIARARVVKVADYVTSNETFARARVMVRLRSEVERVNEQRISVREIVRLFAETVRVAEVSVVQVFKSLYKWINETVRPTEFIDYTKAMVRAVSEFLHVGELLNFIIPIPSLVCSAILLYARIAGECGLAPVVMGSPTLAPELEGQTGLDITVDAQATLEECD